MTAQKVVIHQHTNSVGLSSLKVLSGGGSEYNAMVSMALRTGARHPPQRDEGERREFSRCGGEVGFGEMVNRRCLAGHAARRVGTLKSSVRTSGCYDVQGGGFGGRRQFRAVLSLYPQCNGFGLGMATYERGFIQREDAASVTPTRDIRRLGRGTTSRMCREEEEEGARAQQE